MQACPYDALYIDPNTSTAAKCHYCAHRIEVGLEPACVIVCPEQAIVAGDLDDPQTPIARLVAREPVEVRKPEQGTRPKVFYVGAESSALVPQMQTAATRYLWSQRPAGELDLVALVAQAQAQEGPSGALSRPVYDVPHQPRPWGTKVAAYLWTKSVAAGALLVAGLGVLVGLGGGPILGVAAPLLALVFLALTTALLVLDLKRPDRFHYVLLKPNPRSWLVRGAWILMAYGAVAVVWLVAALGGSEGTLRLLAVPAVLLALGTAGYSAFLFGQAEGRDFWQSPLLLPQLLLAALMAGAASLFPIAWALGDGPHVARALAIVLIVALVGLGAVLLAELSGSHANLDVARAARLLTRGPWRARFWGGVVVAGILLPLGLVWAGPGGTLLAAVLALVGLWVYEDLWVKAGQSLPLS
jgi:formate-dependent nitrite reductase membrane component NrfD